MNVKRPGNEGMSSVTWPSRCTIISETLTRSCHMNEFTIRNFIENRLSPLAGLMLDKQPDISRLLPPLNDTML